MTSCIFCQKQDDPRGMKIFTTCNISNGQHCAACAEYITLESEVKQMKDSLMKKLERQREIRENINRQHDCVAVRLPQEIATHIFELAACVKDESEESTSLREGETYAPLFLGAVCRAWRDVAWSIPQLWTFIHIHIPDVEDLPARLEIAKQWFSRSGNHLPLSIHLRTHETYDAEDVFTDSEFDRLEDELFNTFDPLLKLVALHSHRWEVLCVDCPPTVMEYFLEYYKGPPILQTLQLSAIESPRLTFQPFRHDSNPPRPTSVLLKNIKPHVIGIDWSQVTSFTIASVDHLEYVVETLLPRMPSLINLTMRNIGVDQRPSQITHSKIQSLVLDVSVKVSGYLVDAITLPSLSHLSIDLTGSGNVLESVVSLIRRSSCNLVSMSLGNVPDAAPTISNLLGCIDSLKNLEIRKTRHLILGNYDCYFLRAVMTRIRDSRNNRRLSPLSKLQRLSYTLHPDDDNTTEFVINLIVDPNWTKYFPKWRRLSIFRDPSPAFFNTKEGIGYVLERFPKQTSQRLLALVDSGIELFLPLQATREDILELLEDRMTSTMQDLMVLQNLLSVLPA